MRVHLFLVVAMLLSACNRKTSDSSEPVPLRSIAFGSCAEQYKPQPVLDLVLSKNPDLFIYLGDNIYSDTYSMDTLRRNYERLGAKTEFRKLREAIPILATWDDHDYGWNDSGRHYRLKAESKEIFLDFFGVSDSTVLQHEGIYYSKVYGPEDKRVQIIMLDMRTFRDKVLPYNGNRTGQAGFDYELEYAPYTTADSTMLGTQQWAWLEQQLTEPARLRIIGSSTQFGITHNGYEAWANFPHEQMRMTDLIKKTRANGVIFISGDVHYAEISRLEVDNLYPIYDITASGITSTWDFATPNDNRVDGPVMENHFGLITIDWEQTDPEITMEIWDVSGERRILRTIRLSELK